MKFTNQRVPDDGWGVVRDYIAINRKNGNVLAPMNDDQINGRNGPLWANQFAGADWVWAELTKEGALSLLAQPAPGAMPASNVEEIETLRAQVRAGVELSIDLRAVIIGLRDSVSNALDRIDSKKL